MRAQHRAAITLLCLAACSAPPMKEPMKCEAPNVPAAPRIFPVDADLGTEVNVIVGNGQLSNCQPFEASARVEISDPDNLPVPAQVTSVTHIGIQLSAAIRFTPVKLGFHHIVVTWSNASVGQRDVFVLLKAQAGSADPLPAKCTGAQPLPQGWVCQQPTGDWRYVTPDGGGRVLTTRVGAVATEGDVLWMTDLTPSAHPASRFVERDGGLVEEPGSIDLGADAGGFVLLPGANDVIVVGASTTLKVRYAANALTADTAQAAGGGAGQWFFRDGDGYAGLQQSFEGAPGLCRHDFGGQSSCTSLPGVPVGLTRDGAWTFENHVLTLYGFDGVKKAELGVGTFEVWRALGVLPVVGRLDPSTFSNLPMAVPVFTDAGIVLERIPDGTGGAFAGVSDRAFWWDGAALRR